MVDSTDIWEDKSLWWLDWSRRLAFQINEEKPEPMALEFGQPTGTMKFQRFREAAVRARNVHLLKGGSDRNWPGVYLHPRPDTRPTEQESDEF